MSQLIAPRFKAAPIGLTHFKELPDEARVRLPVVAALFSCSAATIWRRVASKQLPQPTKFGNVTSWKVGDLRAFLATMDTADAIGNELAQRTRG
jgi:predicted DNA-binding transcriptional regulator AlpA